MTFKLTVLDDRPKLPKKSMRVRQHRVVNPPQPVLAGEYYKNIVRDQYGEIMVPDNTGGFLRLLDLCSKVAEGSSISEACTAVGVHPVRFMTIRDRFPEIDDTVRAAMELAGEEDIARATRLIENLDISNFKINREKVGFFVWRGKNRYYRLYGEKANGGINIDASQRNTTTNTFELSSTIRTLEKKEPILIEQQKDDYECE